MPALLYYLLALIQASFVIYDVNSAIHTESSHDQLILILLACLAAFAAGWSSAFGTIKIIQRLAR